MPVSFPRFVGLCLIGSLLVACSESTEDDGDGNRPSSSSGAGASGGSGSGSGAGASGSASGGGPGAGGTGSGASGSGGAGSGGSPAAGDVVINEVRAAGDDYVELYNAGTAPFDLSGFGVCDTADDGMPKIDAATRFVDGEMLAPGAFLVIVADLKEALPGPQTTCIEGVTSCYQATWGISAGNGEKIFLLDAADAQADVAEYGPDVVPEGQTIGHIPDGEGAFVSNAPTPGAANAAP